MKCIRHGDVALVQIDKLPEGLNKSNTRVFLAGKNNNHEIDNGDIYITKNHNTLLDNEFLYGYIVANNTILIHNEHSPISNNRNALIEDGIYALYKQKESTPTGFKIVKD